MKDTLDLDGQGLRIGNEFGGEIYYDFAITEGFRVPADFQVINPIEEDKDTAIFAGIRTRFIF